MSKTKSILFILVFAIAIAMLTVTVNAATPTLPQAQNGVITLTANVGANDDRMETVTINQDTVLDLNGFTIYGNGESAVTKTNTADYSAIIVDGKTLTIKDSSNPSTGKLIAKTSAIKVINGGTVILESGTIETTNNSYSTNGNVQSSGIFLAPATSEATANKAIINGGSISAFKPVWLYEFGKATVNGGTLEAKDCGAAIAVIGNATKESATEIVINNGTLTSNSTAIYHAGYGTLVAKSGTITGATGIEMRAGELTIPSGSDVIIKGTATPTEFKENGNGSTIDGAGIGVSQHNTALDLKINVNGGTIQGYTALYEENQNVATALLETLQKVNINVNGGNFEAINGGTKVFISDTTDSDVGNAINVKSLAIHQANIVKPAGSTTFEADVTKYLADDAVMNITSSGATVVSHPTVMDETGSAYGTMVAAGDIMNVDITWGKLTYLCTEVWNPDTHTYDYTWTSTKAGTDDKITVKNHSNIDVEATFAYTSNVVRVNGTFSSSSFVLDKYGTQVAEKSVTLTISNEDGVSVNTLKTLQSTKIGTVKVTLQKSTPQ